MVWAIRINHENIWNFKWKIIDENAKNRTNNLHKINEHMKNNKCNWKLNEKFRIN